MKDKIKFIFKTKLREEVTDVIDSSRGSEQQVFIVTTDEGCYVIKFPHVGNQLMLLREAYVCENFRGKLPTARIVLKGDGYLVETFIEGTRLSETSLTDEEAAEIYCALGQAVRTLHAQEMEGFGEMQPHRKGQHMKLNRHIGFVVRRDLPALRDTGLFTERELAALGVRIKRDLERIEGESRLLHFDLLDTNVLVKDGKLSGLIDFGDLSCGPCAYDLAKFYIEKEGTPHLAHFLAGYGEVPLPEIEYFALLHLLYELPYYHKQGPVEKTAHLAALLRRLLADDPAILGASAERM
jgi:Ser/Thr protein kinase RdoA (MazF antagonist)